MLAVLGVDREVAEEGGSGVEEGEDEGPWAWRCFGSIDS